MISRPYSRGLTDPPISWGEVLRRERLLEPQRPKYPEAEGGRAERKDQDGRQHNDG